MRAIGTIQDKELAHLFSDFLISQNIPNKVEESTDMSYLIWIVSEDQLDDAQQLLTEFRFNPSSAKYKNARGAALKWQKELSAEQSTFQKQNINFKKSLKKMNSQNWMPITMALMAISILIGLATQLGKNTSHFSFLFISDFSIEGPYMSFDTNLAQFLGLNFVRLFTPMFLHFGFLHILFNMMWLKDLGNIIEKRHGSLYFLILVLVISGISNLAQFIISGPSFGGMSGVVYGLLGYLWIRGKCDPYYDIIINKQVVYMMIAWFFLCLIGLMGPVANTVHGAGLAVGMIWGFLSSKQRKLKKY